MLALIFHLLGLAEYLFSGVPSSLSILILVVADCVDPGTSDFLSMILLLDCAELRVGFFSDCH